MEEPARKSVKVKEIYFDIREAEGGREQAGFRFILENGQEIGLTYYDHSVDQHFPLTPMLLKK